MRQQYAIHFIAVMAIVSGCSSEPVLQVQARVLDYGLYVRGNETIVEAPFSPSGTGRAAIGSVLRETTRAIPLLLGTSFGFCYELSGFSSDANVSVVVAVKHPTISQPERGAVNTYAFTRNLKPVNRKLFDCTGYGFDHSYELVAGDWNFTVIVNGRAVLSQVFIAG